MKTAFRYLRFSDKDQSNGSIERQDIVTKHWCDQFNVKIIETFVDDGYTARNFDRPDMIALFRKLKQIDIKPDFLVVSELTRFSRELGDGLNKIIELQKKYGVQTVSAGRGQVYDAFDHTSRFHIAIELGLGNSENLKRSSDINGGIYTAKAKEGRYIGPHAPFGFRKEGIGKYRKLVVVPEEARIIQYIFKAFLNDVPATEIKKEAERMGMNIKGNSVIDKILSNPIYIAQQKVKAWKDLPGGIYPVNVAPIIDPITWHDVKNKLRGEPKVKVSVVDQLPLKGALHCHCGRLLTGAPSRSKSGRYYYYYKCQVSSKHNNINANKIHQQLDEILQLISIPKSLVEQVIAATKEKFNIRSKENRLKLDKAKVDLSKVQSSLSLLEEKYINNRIEYETYSKWYSEYQSQISYLKAIIEKLSLGNREIDTLLHDAADKISNLNVYYQKASISAKQQLLNKVFDSKLYYFNGVFRTPYIYPLFKHNLLILKEKHLLFLEEKREFSENSLQVELNSDLSNTDEFDTIKLAEILTFFQELMVA